MENQDLQELIYLYPKKSRKAQLYAIKKTLKI